MATDFGTFMHQLPTRRDAVMNENPTTEQCAQNKNNTNDEDDVTGTEHAIESRKEGEERPKQGSNKPRYLDDYVAK